MDVAAFVKLSTRVCEDLRLWIEEARGQALLSEGQLLTLSDAADVIRRATTTLTANAARLTAHPRTMSSKTAPSRRRMKRDPRFCPRTAC